MLDILPQTRLERRKEKRTFQKKNINQQYSYTTFEAISAESQKRNGSFDWLPSKEGQSIEQWWLDRINQQKNASSYTKPIPMGCFGVHENNDTKLDDTIRKYVFTVKHHQEVNYEGGNEWILTNVSDIYKELNFYPTCVDDIINNPEFMKLWFDRIRASKYAYFKNNEIVSKVYKLKEWQSNVVDEMIGSKKTYHILGLAPRFGKTLTVLDYFKRKILNLDYSKGELWLVPVSKSLSSNSSFFNDYKDFGFSKYFNIINTSLFVDDEKIIQTLKEQIPLDAKIVLITDEGDLASHTTISIDKIESIKNTFEVVEQIVMTGTGIGKATKIFKGVSIDLINQIYVTYSEMVEIGGQVVKRNFINVQYDIKKDFDEEVLNIRQSVDDPINHPQLAKYIGDFTINSAMEARMNLQPTEIVMVFIKPSQNKYLTQLVTVYENMYSDKVKCLILTGSEGANNRKAESDVKRVYDTMRKNGDNRKLIVFSAGIGSRSFSVSKIYREINFCDSELTSATIQEFARVLTFEDNKEVADIIRIGFTPMELAEQLYLAEHDVPDYSEKSYSRARMFLMNNSFASYDMFQNGSFKEEKLVRNGVDDDIIGKFLDNVCKFSDSTNYYMTRWSGEGLVIDSEPVKNLSKSQTKVVNTNLPNKKNVKDTAFKSVKVKITAEDERKLKQYVNIVRCIPSIANIVGMNTISEFLNSGYWKNYINIDQKLFEQNYNSSEEFKGGVDALFRQNIKKTKEENSQRLVDYMKFIS
jgi:hypothetical protein